jgi:hypothetical protein
LFCWLVPSLVQICFAASARVLHVTQLGQVSLCGSTFSNICQLYSNPANFCQLYSNIYQLSPFQTTYNPLSANNITPTLPTFFANSIYSNLYQLSPLQMTLNPTLSSFSLANDIYTNSYSSNNNSHLFNHSCCFQLVLADYQQLLLKFSATSYQ